MLRVEDLKLKIGNFSLNIENFELKRKKNFLMGENGSGKTTFLRSLCGIYNAQGKIFLDGERIDHLPIWKRKLAYIPQNLLLFPQYNVEENLRVSINYGNGDEEIFKEIVKIMNIEDILDKNIHEISGGQAQRVAVARAIISRPKFLLMDEPFSMQDERSRMSLISGVLDLLDNFGISYIYVTHNSRDLELGFDSLSVMHEGRIIESVERLEDLENYLSLRLIDYRNIVKIDGKYYKVNEDSFEFSNDGYPVNCSKYNDEYICTVNIDNEKFFIKSKNYGKFIKFNKMKMKELK